METWILMADEAQASLLVQSSYGPFYEIEQWRRQQHSVERFAEEVVTRVQSLQSHFDALVMAAPPQVLDQLGRAIPAELQGKVKAQHARYLTHLSQRELRQELAPLCAN
jgi:protein required for attachment to host cells